MDTIFTRGPSLNIRLTLALVLSVTLIFVDHKMDGFKSTRVYLNSLMSPLQYIANLPGLMLSESAQRLTSQEQLLAENQKLNNQLLLMSEKLQQFDVIEKENAQLRELLQAPVRESSRKMVAELMAVDKNPYSQQVVINKGAIDGVYPSQPVIDDKTNDGGTDNVWFYDMQADGFSLDDKRTPLIKEQALTTEADAIDYKAAEGESLEKGQAPSELENHKLNNIPDVLFRWQHLQNETGRERTEQSFFVPLSDIQSNYYDLSINRYKEVVYEEVEYDSPKVILERIKMLQAEMDRGIADLEKFL